MSRYGKKEEWWKKWLFYAFVLLVTAILAAGITFIILLFLDWYFYPIPPHLTGRSQRKFHNSGLLKRMGWETALVVYVVTYLVTAIYCYLKFKIEDGND